VTDLSQFSDADLLAMYRRPSAGDVAGMVASEAARQGVDPALALRVARQESGFRSDARSPKGAVGPMQLLPSTAAELGVDPTDPAQNVMGGVTYLKRQMDTFGDPALAAAAYNAGPGAVRKYGGVPPFAETKNYVSAVASPPDVSRMSNAELLALYGTAKSAPAQVPIPRTVRPQQRSDPTVAQDAWSGFAQPFINLGHDVMQRYRADEARLRNPPAIPSSPIAFAKETGADLMQTMGAVGDVLGLASAPVQAVVRPTARAINRYGPTPYVGGGAQLDRGKLSFALPHKASPDEAQTFVENALNTALSAARPANVQATIPPVQRSPLTNFPLEQPVTSAQVRAAKALDGALSRDNLTPYMLREGATGGALPLDAGGANVRSLAEVLAKSPGPGAAIIKDALGDRGAQAIRDRVVGGLEGIAGVDPSAVAGDFAGLNAQLRAQATPLYDKAYAAGPIDSPNLEVLRSRPSLGRAMSRAVRIAAEEGRDPTELGFRVVSRGDGATPRNVAVTADREGGLSQVIGSKEVQDPKLADIAVQLDSPTAQTWDYVKRGLDDILEGYRDKTTGKLRLDEEGRAIVGTTKALRKELVDLNPAYGDALAAGGEPLRLEDAYRSAGKLMDNSVSERLFQQRWQSMSPSEQQAFRGGWLNHVYEKSQGGALNLRSLTSPAYQAKLSAVFGKQAAQDLTTSVRQGLDLQGVGQRMLGGSPTYPLQAARADLESQGGDPLDLAEKVLDATASPLRAGRAALKVALKALPRQDRSVLGNAQANATLAKALTDPSEMDKLLAALNAMKTAPAPVSSAFAPFAPLPLPSRLLGASEVIQPLTQIGAARRPVTPAGRPADKAPRRTR
jgi:soluble lytic murein transglycosylase-like protein